MKHTTRLKAYMPFTYKMMIPYLLLVLLTDISVGYLSYTMLIDSRTEMAETNIRTAMEQTRNNVKYQMDEIQRMSDTLFGSVPFQRALQRRGEPLQIYLTMLDEIVPQIQAPLQLFGNKIRLILYTMNPDLNEVPGEDLNQPITKSDYYILPFDTIRDAGWFRSFTSQNRDNVWVPLDTDRELQNISQIRKLVSFNDYTTTIGYLRITANLEDLLGNFDTFPVEEGISLRLIDRTTGESLYQRGQAALQAQDQDVLKLTEDIPGSSFTIETFVPPSYLTKDASKLQMAISAVCAASFLVMAMIGLVVARLSGRKMSRIVGLVRSFEEGNFRKRIHFSGNDEFVHIADAFNVMATNIQELIDSVYVQGIQKKQAELEALQAQINPHFLYNTLSAVSSLANLGETDKVTGMVRGLSKFYRLTLNQGQVYIPLAKELEQVETYLDIQRVKYADRFTVSFDVEESILGDRVIKLILQPFVENIFKHAWFEDTIAIRIVGRKLGDRIELKVIDNGIGMKPETVRGLLDGPSLSGGYGLKNVDERIKLRYGPGYGIEIASVYGGGTSVRILLPAEDVPELRDAEQAQGA
ncbi:sensor histidine kinase [Cohnella candidum]|uniref:Sensor histidine kinase n=1 Tax=Cohnella candidum TaxID=2674991 RepID=A0A3G3JTV3_9BACL|nr:sensor histidine kinase [Cohnella candidum]AYQ71327.1 sensor histidine kinase [Cohnella candidum]